MESVTALGSQQSGLHFCARGTPARGWWWGDNICDVVAFGGGGGGMTNMFRVVGTRLLNL